MGKWKLWTPVKSKPLNRLTQFVRIDYVHERNVCSKFGKNRFTGDFWAKGWNITFCVTFLCRNTGRTLLHTHFLYTQYKTAVLTCPLTSCSTRKSPPGGPEPWLNTDRITPDRLRGFTCTVNVTSAGTEYRSPAHTRYLPASVSLSLAAADQYFSSLFYNCHFAASFNNHQTQVTWQAPSDFSFQHALYMFTLTHLLTYFCSFRQSHY